jgi:hypothetical protein
MPIQIEEIRFNHSPNSASADAVNVRRNGADFGQFPEWVRNLNQTTNQSVAVYLSRQADLPPVTIQARFSATSPEFNVMVRALDDTGTNVLGVVVEGSVNFAFSTQSQFATLELANTRLRNIGVGSHVVRWRWQARRPTEATFSDIGETSHRIFTVLAQPTAPWTRQPFTPNNFQLPWIEVLEHACRWADRARTQEEAARQVTERVFRFGNDGTLRYDQYGGRANYSFPEFLCTDLLEVLAGRKGRGPNVNCSDTATIVSSFSNILGCELSQARMGGNNFDINLVRLIGFNDFDRNFGNGGFNFHEVAWTGNCGVNDGVFDACLQVDNDPNPAAAPHDPLLPRNLRFGNVGDRTYRDKLTPQTPTGGQRCNPVAGSSVRRPIRDPQAPAVPLLAETMKETLFERFDFLSWVETPVEENVLVLNFKPSGFKLAEWQIENVSEFETGPLPLRTIESVWTREVDGDEQTASIDVYECDSRIAARRFLLELLAQSTLPALAELNDLGDRAFAAPAQTMVIFAHGNLAVSVCDLSIIRRPVLELAYQVDKSLVARTEAVKRPRASETFDLLNDSLPEGLPLPGTDENLTLRFFSKTGEFRVIRDRLYYVPFDSEQHEIERFVVDEDNNTIDSLLISSN